MQIPQIRLQSVPAKIQIEQIDAKQEIRQPKAELSIQQPAATMSIQSEPGKLQIDQTRAWEDMNRMHVFRLNEKFADEGKQKVLEGTGRRASEGTEMMKIEHAGNIVASQAVRNAFEEMKPINIAFIPSPFSVKVNYEPGEVVVDVKQNKAIIEATAHKVEHQYQPGKVDIRLSQHPSLEINFVNVEI
ncbi:DUF6470 family protein [Oceanobacillus bengalensis]|uniref:YviE n=1 Tax=Oceanobacillus bengalensis TaxID=1435466 RepID=A0A494Z6K9_9BACI|nr:DUF6470 family protein [Oceanobacillus bengalensis]RKQ18218.1 hypothetical protein D8M05_02095 [Oceanobacillus bengalensis]